MQTYFRFWWRQGQPEIRLRSQANNKETPDNLLMI